ncbi:hypothetical protein ACHAWF_013137 [Thalassiosira exigua]
MDLKFATLTLGFIASASGQNLRAQRRRQLNQSGDWQVYCLVMDSCNIRVSDLEDAASSALSSWETSSTSSSTSTSADTGTTRRALNTKDRRELKSRSAAVTLDGGCSSKDMADSIQSAMSSESSDTSTSSDDLAMDCVSERLIHRACDNADARDIFYKAVSASSGSRDRGLKSDVDVSFYTVEDTDLETRFVDIGCNGDEEALVDVVRDILHV